ncbi:MULTISPECIES: MFS transporter [unclassified Pseudodesulfovibrio]|uniref:MFS transporter n=1 Tax=unclassified Pseudodesulfovibrio TaxID=2661612 RepID=UPI000FEB9E8B|nr:MULTISPECIES: MFS transporter [unclassified Pseudodesulfovibrio]MCJ2165478.1 MFS transporter [Pseudodesulfovibrio sp. S3-i]RWU03227.1 MFS transporter [Pseudodesulfovibrio sp. S3]
MEKEFLTELCDNSPLNSFHKHLAVYSAGGPFLDGYVMGMIGIALVQITPFMQLSLFWEGMIGAATLAGMFLGGFAGGWFTDKYGRQVLYTIDLIALGVFSLAQFWVDGPLFLFILRFLLGMAIGADYPIATALLAEFTPKRFRGPFIGTLQAMWFVGASCAYIVGDIMLGYGPEAWRWMLASAVLPSVLFLFMRRNTPESPRWLIQKGRYSQARAVLKRVYDQDIPIELMQRVSMTSKPVSIRRLFQSGYGTRMLFITIFWTCAIVPLFAVYSFAPKIMAALGLAGSLGHTGAAILTVIFMIGCIVPLPLVNTIGRRSLLLHSFFWSGVALLLLGVFTDRSPYLILALFAIYALATGGSQNLQFIYPNELFPTEIRASAVGLASSLSRIGAAIGTYLVPLALARLDIKVTMMIAAGITFLGYVVSLKMAPETRDCSLEEAACCEENETVGGFIPEVSDSVVR